MMHGKAIWKPGSPAARVNVLKHVGLWPTAIKLNPLWKMELSKSAWIKPRKPVFYGLRDFSGKTSVAKRNHNYSRLE